MFVYCFFFSSRRRHTRLQGDWSSDVCSSDLNRQRSHRSGDRGRPVDSAVAAADDAAAVEVLVAKRGAGVRVGRERREIGRASCRERGERGGGAGEGRTKEKRRDV